MPEPEEDTGIEDAIIKEMKTTRDALGPDELAKITTNANQHAKATAFLLGSDRTRYGKLIEDLENDYLQGSNNYPKTVIAAYNLLTNWKQDIRHGWHAPTADGVAFATDGKKSTGKKPVNVTCHKCGIKGHYATDCPELSLQKEDRVQPFSWQGLMKESLIQMMI